MKHVIYVFSDTGSPQACKIGKDENWPKRYIQARCHSPRGIVISGLFGFASKDAVRLAEQRARTSLAAHRRPGDVQEWFDLAAVSAIERLEKAGILDPRAALATHAPNLPASALFYDDWREQGAASNRFRWQLWLFREESTDQRLKLSYGALYDTAFKYAFTYNPWPVRLIAGFEHPDAVAAEDDRNRQSNVHVRKAWESLQGALGSLKSEEVGWLRSQARPEAVASHLAGFGIRPFLLDRPKPSGVRPKDASVAATAIGAIPPQGRVRPCPSIYGSGSVVP